MSDLYADDLVSDDQLITALSEADAARPDGGVRHAIGRLGLTAAKAVIFLTPDLFITDVLIGVRHTMVLNASEMPLHDAHRAESEAQPSLLRDMFGNPFRPMNFSPS